MSVKLKKTDKEHIVRQSVNQKVERSEQDIKNKVEESEQDVKSRFSEWFLPLYVVVVLNLLVSFVALFGQ